MATPPIVTHELQLDRTSVSSPAANLGDFQLPPSDTPSLVRPVNHQELAPLLDAPAADARDAAWSAFVVRHTRLMLQAAHETMRDPDAALDAYAYVLEKLQEDDMRRLRRFAVDGRGAFDTWLFVVARRLCLDFLRQRYGRAVRAVHEREAGVAARQARRRLVDLASEALDVDAITDLQERSTEQAFLELELLRCLDEAMKHLPPRDRLLLKLRFEDGLRASEIAPLLQLPTVFHVYRRINHALAEVRTHLRARGVTSSAP